MVTRRFKKVSVYDALASTSGLDFSPKLKTYSSRKDETSPITQVSQTPEIQKGEISRIISNSPYKQSLVVKEKGTVQAGNYTSPSVPTPEISVKEACVSKCDKEAEKCVTAHAKFPSWPVVESESSTTPFRSHSWTSHTDYPKEKVGYSRPKKAFQYKISTNQLQPVLERSIDYNGQSKLSPDKKPKEESCQYVSRNKASEFLDKQFDFDGFHTPCIPECYNDKNYKNHSPAERDACNSLPIIKSTGPSSTEMNGYNDAYEESFRSLPIYTEPAPNFNKQKQTDDKSGLSSPDTPFLDRLRLENSWKPPTVPVFPVAVPQSPPTHLQQQQIQGNIQQPANDFELSSENGTWMGSMESSSHGRGIVPKWEGSYSDLSTLSTQLSNRSSLFDSGHSTMPESGRLSPGSSCDSTAPSMLSEGPTRAQVIARHGGHREIVAHSARVQQPERYGSESVLYYATGSSRSNGDIKGCINAISGVHHMAGDEALFRSHASLTLSPSSSNAIVFESKAQKCPTRQDSRTSNRSFSSDDSYSRQRCMGDDTSCSSSDISNITCVLNYQDATPKEGPPLIKEPLKPKNFSPMYPKYTEPSKSKSMDETSRKLVFPEPDKRQRVSDPDLKAFQKQAVMSFYQRMSLAESIKSDGKPAHSAMSDGEAMPMSRLKIAPNKLSLPIKGHNKQWPPRSSSQTTPQTEYPPKGLDQGLVNNHSKSVPNLVMLKGQSLDLLPSHPTFKPGFKAPQWTENNKPQNMLQKGSPLAKDEIISWDELPNVLEKKREATEKAASSGENKDLLEHNGGFPSGMHYLKSHKSPRKVQLKEVHHPNEPSAVRVITPEGITLVQAHEKPPKRRPAPPPPPKQPPRRPPPPPPPASPSPPPTQVVVHLEEHDLSENGLPLPPPPENEALINNNEPMPPPPELKDSSPIYPKNSYMSYRSERKISRQGFDGKYRRSLHNSDSSVDLSSLEFILPNGRGSISPKNSEEHDRKHGTTVIFRSEFIPLKNHSQRGNSNECVHVDSNKHNSDNISKDNNLNKRSRANMKNSEDPQQPVPNQQTSQENVPNELNTLSSDQLKSTTTKGLAVKSKCGDRLGNSESTEKNYVLDNTKSSDINVEVDANDKSVDHNQNSVTNNQLPNGDSEAHNGNELVKRINISAEIDKSPRFLREATKEELECEKLSRDFINQYGDIALKTYLAPAQQHIAMFDYMSSLLNVDVAKSKIPNNISSNLDESSNIDDQKNDIINNENDHSSMNNCAEMNDNHGIDCGSEMSIKKEELIASVVKKVESLKCLQKNIREDMRQNELLGQKIAVHLQEIAKPNEVEKFVLHVEEMEKIINLMLSLSGRLARAENLLKNVKTDSNSEDKKMLETRRDKLREQHEDACRLKENIDRRSNQVSMFLHNYLNDEEFANYDHFINMKTKLIFDLREIDEKINLGEEQLAALSVVAHYWKSANSNS